MKRARRGRGDGAIYQRSDGQWCASLTVGYTAEGRRRRRTIYGRTRTEIREKLTNLQMETVSGIAIEPNQLTVAQYLNHWLENIARPQIRESTYYLYEGLIRLHINPRIGGLRLRKLTPVHIEELYGSLRRDGVSARQCQLIHARLYTAFKRAARLKLIAHNPSVDVDRPTATAKRFSVLTPAQVKTFLAAAETNRLYALYVVAITTGLRQGEMLGLWHENFDAEAAALFVSHQLTEVRGRMSRTETKTNAGRRRVDLPQFVVAELQAHVERMRAEGHEGPWIFCNHRGEPIRKDTLRRKSFEKILEQAKLPRIRFHDLRHTAATLLLAEDTHPKIVQERLGHARIGITLDTYSHMLPSMQKQATEKLDAMFRKPVAEPAAEETAQQPPANDAAVAAPAAAAPESDNAELIAEVRQLRALMERAQARAREIAEEAGNVKSDWLQFGYKPLEPLPADDDEADLNPLELLKKGKWSHLESNQGPPACEAGALTN